MPWYPRNTIAKIPANLNQRLCVRILGRFRHEDVETAENSFAANMAFAKWRSARAYASKLRNRKKWDRSIVRRHYAPSGTRRNFFAAVQFLLCQSHDAAAFVHGALFRGNWAR
jgi:hypothetical protein